MSFIGSAVFLLPASRLKNWVLNLLGNEISKGARVHPTIVVGRTTFRIEAGAEIGKLNLFRNLRLVEMKENSYIGGLNFFSAHPPLLTGPAKGILTLGVGGKIMSRHYLDCSGSVLLGAFSSVSGHGTRFLSHSTDLKANVVASEEISVGDRCFIGAYCLLLPGSRLSSRSVLAAGSVLSRSRKDALIPPSGLWAGVPASFKRPYDGEWFTRETPHTDGFR